MIKSKKKGLFVDISEFSVLAVRTSGYEGPIIVEEAIDFPIESGYKSEDIRSFLGKCVDIKSGNYEAICGIYPKDRFICYHEVESGVRLKNQILLEKLLRSDLGIDPKINDISILNSHDGSIFDPTKNASNRLIFCGAPTAELQKVQDQILSFGLLPKRMELTSVASIGGFSHYMHLNKFESAVTYVELLSECTNVIILNKGEVGMVRTLDFGLNSLFPLLQDELGLKDEASAVKLFHSNTFDVAEIGPKLLQRILEELKAILGNYEVQTGLNVDRFFVSLLPQKLSWIPNAISSALGIDLVSIQLEMWLQSLGISVDDSVDLSALGSHWLGVFSLIAEFNLREESVL